MNKFAPLWTTVMQGYGSGWTLPRPDPDPTFEKHPNQDSIVEKNPGIGSNSRKQPGSEYGKPQFDLIVTLVNNYCKKSLIFEGSLILMFRPDLYPNKGFNVL